MADTSHIDARPHTAGTALSAAKTITTTTTTNLSLARWLSVVGARRIST